MEWTPVKYIMNHPPTWKAEGGGLRAEVRPVYFDGEDNEGDSRWLWTWEVFRRETPFGDRNPLVAHQGGQLHFSESAKKVCEEKLWQLATEKLLGTAMVP